MTYITLDIETDGADGPLLAVGYKEAGLEPEVLSAEGFFHSGIGDLIRGRLADASVPKVVFTRYDHRYLRRAGVVIRGDIFDVQVMAWAVNETTDLDLDSVYRRYVGEAMDKRLVQVGGRVYFVRDDGERVPMSEAPWDELAAYCARDVEATERLFVRLAEGLGYDDLHGYFERECVPLSEVLLEMELRGLPVDLERSKRLRVLLEGEMEDLEDRLTEGLPPAFNLGSVDHVGAYLYSKTFDLKDSVPIDAVQRDALKAGEPAGLPDGFTVGKVGRAYAHGTWSLKGLGLKVHAHTETGKPATDAKTLQVHHGDVAWVADLLAYKKRATVVQTFLRNFEAMAQDGRIYGRFNQTGTKTGRLSSSGPNLQNIPARGDLGYQVRSLFRPEPGFVFVHADYSMLEPRLMAHFSQDPLLLDVFRNGKDIYLETAQAVFGRAFTKDDPERALMKTYVLAMGYGAGAAKLQATLAVAGFVLPLETVEDTLAELKRVYATFFAWKEDVIAGAAEERYVETLSGHRRRLAPRGRGRSAESWREVGHDERAAVNAVIQGSAADIVARTMVRVHREMPQVGLLAQVHDELLGEVLEGAATLELLRRIQAVAERGHGFDLTVPLSFEPRYVATWAEGKE